MPETLMDILKMAIPSLLASLLTYFLTRPKQKADIDKTYQGLLLEMQEKLPIWIKRYEDEYEEKMEIQGLLRFAETEMHRLSRELKNCEFNKSECRKVIEEARGIFSKFEHALSEVQEQAQLLVELKDFRKRLEIL